MKKIILLIVIVVNTIIFPNENIFKFDLYAHVYDDGQKIEYIKIINEDDLIFDLSGVDRNTFKVHLKQSLPLVDGENIFSKSDGYAEPELYDGEIEVVNVSLDEENNLILQLSNENTNTLYYLGGVNRNILLNLNYDIVQLNDIYTINGIIIDTNTKYVQNNIIDSEADLLIFKKSSNGINYRFYEPEKIRNEDKKYPLIIWLHGNGEGGYKDYQNNVSQVYANRGVVTFVDNKIQDKFDGAYVLAPQVEDTWYNNYTKNYILLYKEMIDEIVENNNIDKNRIYLFGASAGGYMSIRMGIEYPDYFAAIVVSAPAIDIAPSRGGVETTLDDLLKLKNTPLWLIHAKNDSVVNYFDSSVFVYMSLIEYDNVNISIYPDVSVDGKKYNGHFAWIYTSNNIPVDDNGLTLFDWVKSKTRENKE